jgi:hypothetical protein
VVATTAMVKFFRAFPSPYPFFSGIWNSIHSIIKRLIFQNY